MEVAGPLRLYTGVGPGGAACVRACMREGGHALQREEGSGPRVLLKSGPGNRGRSACGPTHEARLEFPRETGLILRASRAVPGKSGLHARGEGERVLALVK